MSEDTRVVRSGHDRRDGEITCGYHGEIVGSNMEIKVMNAQLKSKMNGIIWLLGVSAVMLGGIFTAQLMTAASFSSINTTIVNQQQDIDALKSLTRNHTAIEKTVSDLEKAVQGLNERYPVYFHK